MLVSARRARCRFGRRWRSAHAWPPRVACSCLVLKPSRRCREPPTGQAALAAGPVPMELPRSEATRREFLQGKSAARAARGLLPDDPAAAPPRPTAAPHDAARRYLIHVGRRAMACQFDIILNAGQYSHGNEAAIAALDLVDQLEDQLSVYRDGSEISRVNRRAACQPTTVAPELFVLIEKGLRMYRDTAGAYDLTSGPLSAAWGFLKRAGHVPTEEQLAEAIRRVGSDHVRIDDAAQSIYFEVEGMEINFNSIGKGYALDRCGALLRDEGIKNFLIHGGQSSVLAGGDHAGAPAGGWSVGLRHPLRPDRRLAEFFLQDRALGTSGSGTQFFHHGGKRYGHVIDPRTARPAEGVLSATVLAAEASEADALATAFYVLGPEGAADYCRRHDEVAAVMACPGPRPGSVDLHTFGLPDDAWRLLDEHVRVANGT